MAGSFRWVIWPRKIFVRSPGPLRCRPACAGQDEVVDDDFGAEVDGRLDRGTAVCGCLLGGGQRHRQ